MSNPCSLYYSKPPLATKFICFLKPLKINCISIKSDLTNMDFIFLIIPNSTILAIFLSSSSEYKFFLLNELNSLNICNYHLVHPSNFAKENQDKAKKQNFHLVCNKMFKWSGVSTEKVCQKDYWIELLFYFRI